MCSAFQVIFNKKWACLQFFHYKYRKQYLNTNKYLFYQQLLEREKQFSEEHLDSEKNRGSLLKVLVELAPKPKHGSKISALDIIRVSMQRLAGDWLWQYICATGRSGTKMSMSSKMPQIRDIILLTACKTLSIDPREATSALSVYLKNTSTRASSKQHREKARLGGIIRSNNSDEHGRAQPHSQGRQAGNDFHSGGADPGDSSASEDSLSLLGLQEISDDSDTN